MKPKASSKPRSASEDEDEVSSGSSEESGRASGGGRTGTVLGVADHAADGADVPPVGREGDVSTRRSRSEGEAREDRDARLGHADDGTGDAAAQREGGGEADGEVGAVVVAVQVVVGELAAAEDEVLLEEDARVDGEPVRQEDEERVERRLERGVPGLGEDDVCKGRRTRASARCERNGDGDEHEGDAQMMVQTMHRKKRGMRCAYLPNAWNVRANE